MNYILKIDISGIQKFIFDIPSKGASKQLKARSFYVYSLTHIILKILEERLGTENVKVIYNGGGNLFAYVNAPKETLEKIRTDLEKMNFQGVLFPFMSFTENQGNFKETMLELSKEVLRTKLKRQFSTQTFERRKSIVWSEFTKDFVKSNGFEIKKGRGNENQITLNNYVVEFYGENFEGNILNKLPRDNDESITEFETLAKLSSENGADEKIAALKMDVDNLGALFREKEEDEYRDISKKMEEFFSKTLYQEVLKPYIDDRILYPVFAGGDDLFFIGSFHKITEIAQKIRRRFNDFQKTSGISHKLTLSAGIVVTQPKYPLIHLAEEAEEALDLAKNYRPEKDSICIFGQPMGWEEFDDCEKIQDKLYDLVINKGESKALIQRIKSSDLGFRSVQDKIYRNHKIEIPKVYRLKYYLRNAKNDENRAILSEIFDQYADDLLNDFLEKNNEKRSNPAKYVVAARLTELLTRNIKNQ